MKLKIYWLILFGCFLIEGTLFHWFIPMQWQSSTHLVPLLVLVGIVYSAVFIHRHYALFLGMVFGLLQDVVFYGHMLGVHTFSYGLTGYLVGLMYRNSRVTISATMLMVGLSIVIYESITYALYSLFQIADISFVWFLLRQLLPTLIFNLLFALAVYLPARKWLEDLYVNKEQGDA
jgi:rod shape-determining protein MreD